MVGLGQPFGLCIIVKTVHFGKLDGFQRKAYRSCFHRCVRLYHEHFILHIIYYEEIVRRVREPLGR